MQKLKKTQLTILKFWLPLALVTTCLCGLVYLSAQQNLRISANDPQIQIAEDLANELVTGQDPRYFIPRTTTELSKSLATYIMIFDKSGKLVGSSVTLDGKYPTIPQGVFSSTKNSPAGETRFTWQPKNGVRSAVVIDYYKGPTPGYVLIGRSIKEIEKRENQQLQIVAAAWIVTLVASYLTIFLLNKIKQ
jgi:hypothetical protein